MPGNGRPRSAALLPFLLVGLLVVSVLLLACGYLANPAAFNSDNLLSPAQCDDLLHGRQLTDWHLPGAPYVVPDLLLLAPCQRLMPTLPLAFAAYCLLVHLGMACGVGWLALLGGLDRRSAVVSAACGGMLLAALNLHEPLGVRGMLLIHPGSHVGALLSGLLLLALSARMLRDGSTWARAAAFLILGGLATFSDRLLIVQFLVPLSLALALLAARRLVGWRPAGVQLGLVAAVVLLSQLVHLGFRRMGFHLLVLDTAFGKPRLPDLIFLLRQLVQFIADDPLLYLLVPAYLLAAGRIVLVDLRRPADADAAPAAPRPLVVLAALTFLASPCCIVGALVFGGMARHPAADRYTLSCWFLPPLLLPLLAYWLPPRPGRLVRPLLTIAVVLFALYRVALSWPLAEAARFEQPYPPLARVLDRLARERGPMYGFSGFWSARSNAFFARGPVVLNPFSPSCEPYFHASNPAHFLPENDLGIPPYRFLVVRPGAAFAPNPAVLALTFGEPKEKIAAGADEVWLYDSLRTPPLERFLRARLAERLRRRPWTGPAEPACLASPKANMTPADSAGTVALEPDTACEVRFAGPVTGRLLDVGADSEARLELELYRGNERLGAVSVSSVPWSGATYERPGIQSRLVPLPPALAGRAWDRILVWPRPDTPSVRLAHLLVYAESVPGLEDQRPLPRLPRVRLEAEDLLPINPGTPFTDDADPTASGGRSRRAAVDFSMPVNFTPRLFLPPGRYRLECTLKVEGKAGSGEVASLYVGPIGTSARPASCPLRGSDFPYADRWATHAMDFDVRSESEGIQFGVLTAGKVPVRVDCFDLIAYPTPASAGGDGSPPVRDGQGAEVPHAPDEGRRHGRTDATS